MSVETKRDLMELSIIILVISILVIVGGNKLEQEENIKKEQQIQDIIDAENIGENK